MNHEKIYTERIEIKVSEKQKEKIEKEAKKQGLTTNQFIRNALDWYLK